MHLCFNSQQYYMIINGYIYDIKCLFDPAHETLVFGSCSVCQQQKFRGDCIKLSLNSLRALTAP